MNSMTGFGRGSAERSGVVATVEVRSVNSRYAEVSVRLPRELAARETDVQQQVKAAFARGRFSVTVQVEDRREAAIGLRVDEGKARAYGELLRQAAKAAGISGLGTIRVEDLMRLPDVLVSSEDSATGDDPAVWDASQAALGEALGALAAMRAHEGAALRVDLAERMDALEAFIEDVEQRAPQRVAEARERITQRLADLLEDEARLQSLVESGRLEAEVAILADKLDVTEEVVRLRAHLAQFREALSSDEPVGRKLNFLSQEIGREVNTVGSKSNDAALAHLAVRMKEEVEKVREQVQNVE
jgi:uncharacterized protein (TIGR00255 family)